MRAKPAAVIPYTNSIARTAVVPGGSAGTNESRVRSFELIDTNVFNSEDLVVCEQIQRGLRSGANEALIVGRLEQNLRRFHSSIETALDECANGFRSRASRGQSITIDQR